MKRTKRSVAMSWLACLAVVLSLCMGILLGDKANASRKSGKDGMAKLDQNKPKTDKVAKDLRESARKKSGNDDVSVILQLNDEISNPLRSLLKSNGIKVKKSFINFNSLSADLPASVVETLASFPEVEYISMDSDVRVLGGHVSHTTGADNVRTMGPNGTALDGTGIGIAVLDSGIYSEHDSFKDPDTVFPELPLTRTSPAKASRMMHMDTVRMWRRR